MSKPAKVLYYIQPNGTNIKMPVHETDAPFIPPFKGGFTAWKIGYSGFSECLIELYIPADALWLIGIHNSYPGFYEFNSGYKCRASKAKVVTILNLDTNKYIKKATTAGYGSLTTYKVGKVVKPNSFNKNWNKVCTNGIHFFMNKKQALNWVYR